MGEWEWLENCNDLQLRQGNKQVQCKWHNKHTHTRAHTATYAKWMNEKCAINIYSKFAYLAKCLCCMQIAHTPRVCACVCVCVPATGKRHFGNWLAAKTALETKVFSVWLSINSQQFAAAAAEPPLSATNCCALLRTRRKWPPAMAAMAAVAVAAPLGLQLLLHAACCIIH